LDEQKLSKKASELISNWPDQIAYPSNKSDKDESWKQVEEFYKNASKKDEGNLFYNHTEYMRVFIMAMAIGRNRKDCRLWNELEGAKKVKTMPKSALHEEEIWLMTSIAIAHENSTNVINDPKRIVEICEGYANGGIGVLMSWDGAGTLDRYEEEMLRLSEKN